MLAKRLPPQQSVAPRWGPMAPFATLRPCENKSPKSPVRATEGGSLFNQLFPETAPPSARARRTGLSRGNEKASAKPNFRAGTGLLRQPPRRTVRSAPKSSLRWGEWYSQQREQQQQQHAPQEVDAADELPSKTFFPLDDELRSWLDVSYEKSKASEAAGEDTSNAPTVLVLNSASKNLLESDFFRLARQGQHVAGWAGGIFKVVQARSPLTQEPLGQYFLFFDSRAAAMAYLEHVRRLHRLSRSTLPDQWRRKPGVSIPPPPLLTASASASASAPAPAPALDPDLSLNPDSVLGAHLAPSSGGPLPVGNAAAAARNYTLLPPSATLSMHAYTVEWLRREMLLHMQSMRGYYRRDRHPRHPQRPGQMPSRTGMTSAPIAERSSSADTAMPPVRAQFGDDFLAHLEGRKHASDQHKVLLRLDGSNMTVGAVHAAIDADGRARNLAWRLLARDDGGRGERAISPVRSTQRIVRHSVLNELGAGGQEVGGAGKEAGEKEKTETEEQAEHRTRQGGATTKAYTRFVIAFADAVEARRFVRSWHRRQLLDPRTERVVTVDATALW